MIVEKLIKHLTIASTRFNQKKELQSLAEHKNITLKLVNDALLSTLNNDFSEEDRLAFDRCEKIRNKLLDDETVISYEVFDSDKTARVKDICKQGASGKKGCQFLYSLSKKTNSPMVLEIGTNVGVSGCYILEGIKNKANGYFVSMEGLPQLCKLANEHFTSIVPQTKFDVKQGLFDITFPQILEEDRKFNLLFIDGNHQKEPTLDYFYRLKKKIGSPAILVFDDINWSEGMKDAWDIIKADPDVNYTVDLYRQGIVIIDKEEGERNIAFKLHLSY